MCGYGYGYGYKCGCVGYEWGTDTGGVLSTGEVLGY